MTSKWEMVRLGDVADINPERTSAFTADRIIRYVDISSVSEGFGIASGALVEMQYGKAPGRARRVIRAGDVLVSTVRPNLRAFAKVPAELDGQVASTGFTVLRALPGQVLPDYIWALVRTEKFVSSMIEQATGSNYPAIRSQDVAAHSIALPPLAEQRRIVDLIGALDDAIEAAEESIAKSTSVWQSAVIAELSKVKVNAVKAESLFEHIIGGAWGSPPGQEDTKVLAIGPSAYANSRLEVDSNFSTERSLSSKRATVRVLQKGDLVLERSGGSPTQPVGRVLRMSLGPKNVVPSDFMRLLRPAVSVVAPDFAFWVMWSLYYSGASLPFQKFTTGIRNLNIPDYLSNVEVKIPESIDEQVRIAALAESFKGSVESAITHADSLRKLRSELLTALLSGAHTIPDSYDEVMTVAEELVSA